MPSLPDDLAFWIGAIALTVVALLVATRRPRPQNAAAPLGPSAQHTAIEEPSSSIKRIELPRIDYEEDLDVEPTKVGAPGTEEPLVTQPPAVPIIYDDDAAVDEPTQARALIVTSACAQTDEGLRRKRNEDSLFVSDEESLYVVADGMGGYAGGARASGLAVKSIADAFSAGRFPGSAHSGLPARASELARAIQVANNAIFGEAKANRELAGMGTTVCAARFSPNKQRLYVAHVGDSRVYRLREGKLRQMTADHTMRDHGVTGPEAAHLSRAVGIWPTVPIDVLIAKPVPGDSYLICSDGLSKMVKDEGIARVLREEEDPAIAVERLIATANANGGRDNVTVIIVHVGAAAADQRVA